MSGHGHVTPNSSGMLARCGGPGLCPECAAEEEAVKNASTQGREWKGRCDRPGPYAVSISADPADPPELTLWCSGGSWTVLAYGDDDFPLTEVNEAAAGHLASHGPCTHGLGKDGERLNVLTGGSAFCPSCGPVQGAAAEGS